MRQFYLTEEHTGVIIQTNKSIVLTYHLLAKNIWSFTIKDLGGGGKPNGDTN